MRGGWHDLNYKILQRCYLEPKMESIDHFETERLVAQRLQEHHLAELVLMDRDRRVMATLGGIRRRADTEEYLRRNLEHWEKYGFGVWMFHERESGAWVGRAGLKHFEFERSQEIELAYALMPQYWGRGLATEIATHLLAHGFRDLGLEEIVAFTLTTNRASQRVLQKAGMDFERPISHAGLPHVLYRARAQQWLQSREQAT